MQVERCFRGAGQKEKRLLAKGSLSRPGGDDDVELTAEKDWAFQASRPVVGYVVGLVRPAKTAPKQTKRCVPHSRRTASEILEEGGDDVKSAWPLWAGPHTCYNGNYNGKARL
ncbi:hypothetical protein L1987_89930 [Smallanthus sonchifolius]|nr:hypothetical protein L1987_89930 [Smallanthus sonchifolius]